MKAWLTGRWAIGGAAWIALSAAAWFAGDTLSLGGWVPLEGAAERAVFIVLVGAAWLGWEFWRRRRLQKENEQLLDGIVGAAAGEADSATRAAQEVALLRKRFEDALQVLRKSRFRGADGEQRTVAELPWYMFIGAPGSGKTTALLNAGLRFPLGDPRAGMTLQGVGGTRNCDWWFTDEAVLLDTAGRYTTQESDRDADAAAWLGFLDLLKRFRPGQPLNGAIITLSVSDLVHWNEQEIARYATHVRERVWELTTRLGVRIPLYVMVTKTDLLAGFGEFFSEHDVDGRAQVWGVTYDASAVGVTAGTDAAGRFQEEFAHLERRLYSLLPSRLQEERDLQRRAAVYRFPQQFRGAGPMIAAFLDQAFGSGWNLGEAPMLRGVYFTSGTQEGSPIDRVLGTLARTFNLERKVQPPVVGAGKSFFLRKLLREVVFGESGLAGHDPAQERKRRVLAIAAYAGVAALSFVVALAWTASYFDNRRLIAQTEVRAEAAKRELEALKTVNAGDEAKLLAALNHLRELRDAEGSWPSLGLSQSGKLRAQADRAYRNVVRETLLGHLAVSLENALGADGGKELLDAYEALHAGDAKPVEQAAAALWKLPEKDAGEMAGHLRSGLSEKPLALPRAKDEALVESARRRLGAGKA